MQDSLGGNAKVLYVLSSGLGSNLVHGNLLSLNLVLDEPQPWFDSTTCSSVNVEIKLGLYENNTKALVYQQHVKLEAHSKMVIDLIMRLFFRKHFTCIHCLGQLKVKNEFFRQITYALKL